MMGLVTKTGYLRRKRPSSVDATYGPSRGWACLPTLLVQRRAATGVARLSGRAGRRNQGAARCSVGRV